MTLFRTTFETRLCLVQNEYFIINVPSEPLSINGPVSYHHRYYDRRQSGTDVHVAHVSNEGSTAGGRRPRWPMGCSLLSAAENSLAVAMIQQRKRATSS